MVLAKELNAIFITDDKKAINVAIKEKIRVIRFNNEVRATVVILEKLLTKKIITIQEYKKIKTNLKNENFIF